MAKQNGRIPGTFVSQDELNDLGKLLTTLRDYVVSHEARLELIEGWITEYHAMQTSQTPVEEAKADGTEEAEIEALENEGGLIVESTDDSEEG
jgi:hypothetical protein